MRFEVLFKNFGPFTVLLYIHTYVHSHLNVRTRARTYAHTQIHFLTLKPTRQSLFSLL